jgi:hypothetical protein
VCDTDTIYIAALLTDSSQHSFTMRFALISTILLLALTSLAASTPLLNKRSGCPVWNGQGTYSAISVDLNAHMDGTRKVWSATTSLVQLGPNSSGSYTLVLKVNTAGDVSIRADPGNGAIYRDFKFVVDAGSKSRKYTSSSTSLECFGPAPFTMNEVNSVKVFWTGVSRGNAN